MGVLIGFAVVAIVLGAVLSAWAHAARRSRVLTILIYVVFGGLSVLLLLAGSALLLVDTGADEPELLQFGGLALLGFGLGLGLPLFPFVRRLLARVMPFDPASPTDMMGLSILSALLLGYPFLGQSAPGEATATPVGSTEVVVQSLVFVVLSFQIVGTFIKRDFPAAIDRLGLKVPTGREILIALGLVVVAFAITITSGALTHVFQPELEQQITERLDSATEALMSWPGALTLGLSAGIGEELLLRGAIQPRYGIIFTSLVFAALHVQYGFSFIVIGVFFASVLFGVERQRLNTTAAIITHVVYDVIAVLLRMTA